MILEIGDIIGYKPQATSSLLAFLIKIGARQRHSHVMVYLGKNEIFEASTNGLVKNKFFFDHIKDTNNYTVSRVLDGLTGDEKQEIRKLTDIMIQEGHPYAFYQGFTLFIYKWFNKHRIGRNILRILFKLDEDFFMNCSEAVNRLYERAVGLDLSPKVINDFTAPDDVTYLKSKFLKKIWA